jgi:hypothetical protein
LIITVPTFGHEFLHGNLDLYLDRDAVSMGLENEFVTVGATTFMDRDANGNITSAGEGDSSRKPGEIRDNEDAYPTLVIEVGWSQTWQKLQEKARWWFDKSNGDVIGRCLRAAGGITGIRIRDINDKYK